MATAPRPPLPLGDPPPLVTERLLLRAPTVDDAAAIARIADDRDIARRMTRLPHPYGLADAHFYLREIAPAELSWTVRLAATDALLGIAGLVPTGREDVVVGQEVELGYWLGRHAWGQGFATEAARAIVAYARSDLRLTSLVSGCFADNAASQAVLGKLGFVETGRGERACLAEGRALPFVEMRLTAA